MKRTFSDHRIWVSSGTHWIIAPFDVTLFNPKHLTVQCKVYAMLIAAYICRYNEWPEELSPLMMLQFILDHHAFQDDNPTSFLPIDVICKYHKRAAAKLATWHRNLPSDGDGFFSPNGRTPPRSDPIYELCIDATNGVDVRPSQFSLVHVLTIIFKLPLFKDDLNSSILAKHQFTRHLQSQVLFGRDDYLLKDSVKKFAQGLKETISNHLSFVDVRANQVLLSQHFAHVCSIHSRSALRIKLQLS